MEMTFLDSALYQQVLFQLQRAPTGDLRISQTCLNESKQQTGYIFDEGIAL